MLRVGVTLLLSVVEEVLLHLEVESERDPEAENVELPLSVAVGVAVK